MKIKIFIPSLLMASCAVQTEGIDDMENDDIARDSARIEAGQETAPLPGELYGDPSELPVQLPGDSAPRVETDEYIAQGYTLADQKAATGGITYRAYKSNRGTTISIPESVIASKCGDLDGCTLRMGMYNWDNTGRVASRDNLFFYNTVNRAWRAMNGDPAGSDYNGATEHIMQAWACYFTDGTYSNWVNYGDSAVGFGLLSWNEYNAECWLTIID